LCPGVRRRRLLDRGPISLSRDLHTDEVGADGDHVANFGGEPDDLAGNRRGDFHRRLVCHNRGQNLILPDQFADFDVPFDEFGFSDAFTDIGQPYRMLGHLKAPGFQAARGRPVPDRGSSPIPAHADTACPSP
jgi:hypothetical protein